MTGLNGGEVERLAPVVPLFQSATPRRGPVFIEDEPPLVAGGAGARHDSHTSSRRVEESDDSAPAEVNSEQARDRLVRALGRRGMSVAEAADFLRALGLDGDTAETIMQDLQERRWLSDADLAEQLVHQAVSRRSAGRREVARVLAKRRIPRDVADAAMAGLPDDDAERAREFAESKVRSLSSLPPETAVRRLVGQLQRRGYPGNVALEAARAALTRAQRPSGPVFR